MAAQRRATVTRMEHQFEEFRGEWTRLAAVARREITAGHRGNAADPWPAVTRRAVAELMVEISREVGLRTADFAVTRWLIVTDEPITAAVAAAVAEDRPYQHGGPRPNGPFAETPVRDPGGRRTRGHATNGPDCGHLTIDRTLRVALRNSRWGS